MTIWDRMSVQQTCKALHTGQLLMQGNYADHRQLRSIGWPDAAVRESMAANHLALRRGFERLAREPAANDTDLPSAA